MPDREKPVVVHNCPYCNAIPEAYVVNQRHFVCCFNCGARGPGAETYKLAARRWNEPFGDPEETLTDAEVIRQLQRDRDAALRAIVALVNGFTPLSTHDKVAKAAVEWSMSQLLRGHMDIIQNALAIYGNKD